MDIEREIVWKFKTSIEPNVKAHSIDRRQTNDRENRERERKKKKGYRAFVGKM